MAAANAINAVRQMQALADGPSSAEMKELLPKIVTALLWFLEHPDSHVRLGSARTLTKLAKSYPGEMRALDLAKGRAALAKWKFALSQGSEEQDSRELVAMVEEILASIDGHVHQECRGKIMKQAEQPMNDQDTDPEPASVTFPGGARDFPARNDRGEIVLKIGSDISSLQKAVILDKAVKLSGVVSVTFEGRVIIVSTRTPAVAADPSFSGELLEFVRAQGIDDVTLADGEKAAAGGGAVGIHHDLADDDDEDDPQFLLDDEDDAEPAYLDDDEDADEDTLGQPPGFGGGASSWGAGAGAPGFHGLRSASGSGAGQPQWSFFSQSNWMTGRKVQEFGDDPTIAARLAAAKKKEQDREEESSSRLGQLTSWLTGAR